MKSRGVSLIDRHAARVIVVGLTGAAPLPLALDNKPFDVLTSPLDTRIMNESMDVRVRFAVMTRTCPTYTTGLRLRRD